MEIRTGVECSSALQSVPFSGCDNTSVDVRAAEDCVRHHSLIIMDINYVLSRDI
jgi:hypothetical protein